MEELMRACELLNLVAPITNELEHCAFASFYCMLMEEWCKHNKEDIREFVTTVCNAVKEVNDELGSY